MNAFTIPGTCDHTVKVEGSWNQTRYRDWSGQISSPEPIVAISFLQVGNHLE